MGKTFDTGFLRNIIAYDASGNVGIGGNPSGSFRFDVTGTGRFTSAVTVGGLTNTGNRSYFGKDGSNMSWFGTTDAISEPNNLAFGFESNGTSIQSFRIQTAGSTRIFVNNVGNVGIGVTPTYALDVTNSSSPSLRVRNGALGGTATLLLETANDFSGTCQAYVRVIGTTSNGTSQLTFGTAGASGDSTATERMRIASGGNVLIGTTSDNGQKLQVSGAAKIDGPVYRYNGTTTVGGSITNLTSIDGSSSRTYLIQMIPTNVEANLSYRIFGVIQVNATSGTYTFVSIASQTMDITFSGSTVQARVTNGQQWNFNWTITQLL
jgi:hypothetical protein